MVSRVFSAGLSGIDGYIVTVECFLSGEVLDVDGDCGGYNLQWAWSSGRLAGSSAGKEQND